MEKKQTNNTVNLSVNERIAIFEKFRTELLSSPTKVEKYLESTGIYNRNGKLTKAYK